MNHHSGSNLDGKLVPDITRPLPGTLAVDIMLAVAARAIEELDLRKSLTSWTG